MLLKSLAALPKNKLQLSHELDIDWRRVDGDINKPLNYGFVAEAAMVGICKVYAITQKAIRALELVDRPPYGIEEYAARKLYNRQASIKINARPLGVLDVLITAVLVIAAALVIYFLWPLIVAPS